MTQAGGASSVTGTAEREMSLWLDEACVRVDLEIRDLCSMLRSARAACVVEDHWLLLIETVERMEGLDRCHHLLASAVPRQTELATDIRFLCQGLMAGRYVSYGRQKWFEFELEEMRVDGLAARRMLLLMANIVIERLDFLSAPDAATPLRVRLKASSRRVILTVQSGEGDGTGCFERPWLLIDLAGAGGGSVRRWGRQDKVRISLPAASLESWPF